MEKLFALAGEVVELDEVYFDSATAVAGCMPGILAMLVRDFARAAASTRARRRTSPGGWPSPACTAPPR